MISTQVDHVACHGDEVSAASGFDAACTVARFALDGLAPRPPVALAPPAARSRVRGLAARGNGDLVALVQLDAKAAPLCGIGAAAAPAEARVVDVARSPAPVAAAAPKAPKPKAAAAPPPVNLFIRLCTLLFQSPERPPSPKAVKRNYLSRALSRWAITNRIILAQKVRALRLWGAALHLLLPLWAAWYALPGRLNAMAIW